MQIPLSAEEFAAKARQLAETEGIALTGNSGTISKSGVTASYAYENGLLTVTILNKPFFVSTEYCEEQMRNWLTKANS
jgi:hypothetical protein